mmetsp:Transcript_77529/g.225001  ORF Transcript_77529/g.225001 Transcript_77529/m.225001 type:complete len:423 (-) Transcript_77529:20-1288(-)
MSPSSGSSQVANYEAMWMRSGSGTPSGRPGSYLDSTSIFTSAADRRRASSISSVGAGGRRPMSRAAAAVSVAASARPRTEGNPHLSSTDVAEMTRMSVGRRIDGDAGVTLQECSDLADSAGLPSGVGDYIFQSLCGGNHMARIRRSEVLDTIAILLRGGMMPASSVSPPQRRGGRSLSRHRPPSAGDFGADAGSSAGMWLSRPKASLLSPASARDNLRPSEASSGRYAEAPSPLDRLHRPSCRMNPTLDSSNFMLAWQGGAPFYDEIFIGEKGNTCFQVARGGSADANGGRPHSARASRKTIVASRLVDEEERMSALRNFAAEDIADQYGSPRPDTAAEQAAKHAYLKEVFGDSAGKPSWEMSMVPGPRYAHVLLPPSDNPRGRVSRNARMMYKNHRGELTQDVCCTGAPDVAHSMLPAARR